MSLPIAVNIDGGEGGRIAQSAEQKELDFGERGRYLIDALSKRRNGISSSYPDLLDPSFGSCLRGLPERRQKEWWPDPEYSRVPFFLLKTTLIPIFELANNRL